MRIDVVITSIGDEAKRPVFEQWAHVAGNLNGRLIIIGDEQTGDLYDPHWDFYPLSEQLGGVLGGELPRGHYARKNIGYVLAAMNGATHVFETDDDNTPTDVNQLSETLAGLTDWRPTPTCSVSAGGWFNAYEHYLPGRGLWPRGFPRRHLRAARTRPFAVPHCGTVHQFISSGEPDVDAEARVERKSFDVTWPTLGPVTLAENSWCTWNTQCTLWPIEHAPLMYIPCFCTHRACDILRGLLALPRLWDVGDSVTFHACNLVRQDRNEHDPLRDMVGEVGMYRNIEPYVRNGRHNILGLADVDLVTDPVAEADMYRLYRLALTKGDRQ